MNVCKEKIKGPMNKIQVMDFPATWTGKYILQYLFGLIADI